MRVTIGMQFAPQFGDMRALRKAWMEAEALGVDILWTCDHFHAQILTQEAAEGAHSKTSPSAQNFEATTIQAAMAATTTRPQIGCIVHANSYRNPNLMADIARTIDHISGGRFILGMGSGYLQRDYDEYGYEYGTTASRLADLDRDMPIIRARLAKLNPQPLRRMPILIASMGDKIGLRIVAKYADMWQTYGPLDKMAQKIDVLRQHCKDIGRNPEEIQYISQFTPDILPDADPDEYLALGMKHIYAVAQGPQWDLGRLRELLAWRKSLGA
jgi:probable F420-dependent oxidoreductase